MKDIRIQKVVIEQTTAQKKEISLIFSYNAIHYIISGSGYFNGKFLRAGEGFVCHKGKLCTYSPNPHDPWKYIWIWYDGDDAEKFSAGYEKDEYIFDFDNSRDFHSICVAFQNNTPLFSDYDYARAAFKIISAYHTNLKSAFLGQENQYIAKAESYMQERLHMDINIEKIAHELHLSSGHLRYLFKKYKGISPKAYLTEIRMNRAAELLKTTDYTVGEISKSVGYEDALCFSKAFKKIKKLSPHNYRHRIRIDHAKLLYRYW